MRRWRRFAGSRRTVPQGANFTAGGHELWRVGLGKPATGFGENRSTAPLRMSVEEHMANYQAARALMGKGKSSAKNDAKKSAVKNHAAMR
jgi:hypothetical protein